MKTCLLHNMITVRVGSHRVKANANAMSLSNGFQSSIGQFILSSFKHQRKGDVAFAIAFASELVEHVLRFPFYSNRLS